MTATIASITRTAVGLRRDVILAQMQDDHEQAGHAVEDVRDCEICCRRYGLDGPAEVWVARRPRSEWDDFGDDLRRSGSHDDHPAALCQINLDKPAAAA
jgi:hypothetical protein